MKDFILVTLGFTNFIVPIGFILAMPIHWSFTAMLLWVYVFSILSLIITVRK